jgi:hypothetical protein
MHTLPEIYTSITTYNESFFEKNISDIEWRASQVHPPGSHKPDEKAAREFGEGRKSVPGMRGLDASSFGDVV